MCVGRLVRLAAAAGTVGQGSTSAGIVAAEEGQLEPVLPVPEHEPRLEPSEPDLVVAVQERALASCWHEMTTAFTVGVPCALGTANV